MLRILMLFLSISYSGVSDAALVGDVSKAVKIMFTAKRDVGASKALTVAAGGAENVANIHTSPLPNLNTKPIAKNLDDAVRYEKLRIDAAKGDGQAMVMMSDLSRGGRVSNTGEPYYSYWLFQGVNSATKFQHQATNKFKAECEQEIEKRRFDSWFDSNCASVDSKHYFVGSANMTTGFKPRLVVDK